MKVLDNKLLNKAASGDIVAFEELIRHYERLVFSIAYRMFLNKEDAQDVSQEVLLKVYKNLKSCNDIRRFKSWICTITTNTCIDELRKRKRRYIESIDAVMNKDDNLFDKELKSDELSPEEVTINEESWRDMHKAIGQLSDEYRSLIILRDIEGFSYNELAEITQSNLGTVKSRLSRARNKLKDIFLQEQRKD